MLNRDWKHILANPGDNGHIVQLYQDDDFYSEAISHFAAEGLVRGESIILVATAANWKNIAQTLEGSGFDIDDLFARGQLTLLDANETLPKFMANNVPDGRVFKPLAAETIAKARCGGKYPRVRWWGEMVNVLYVDGNGKGSHQLEQFFDEVAHEHTVAVFCSFLMDQYDPHIYDESFSNVCRTHNFVIPMRNYEEHRDAVNLAISEVIGPVQGELLRSLVAWNGPDLKGLPPSQAMLLWVKEKLPESFCAVLEKTKYYDYQAASAR